MLDSVSTNDGFENERGEVMNVKRFALACLAVYVVYQFLGFVIHQLWLADTYKALETVWRPEAEMMSMMWISFLTSAVWTVLFCYIFTRGYEGKGAMEGARYGLIMGLFMGIPYAYESFMIYPITLGLAHAWFVSGVVLSVISGIVVALIYKPAEA
jgi:hypothetical protein